MCRRTIAYLLVVAILANVGCANLAFPVPRGAEELAVDLAIRRVAAIWKDDIPIKQTEHTLYPPVERLPGTAKFTPIRLPLVIMEDTTPIEPGDYEIPVHFYAMTRAATIPGAGPIPAGVLTVEIPASCTDEMNRYAAKRLHIVTATLTSPIDAPWQGFAGARLDAEDTGEPYGIKSKVGKLAMKALARVIRYTPNKLIRWTAERCHLGRWADDIIANKIKIANKLDDAAEYVADVERVTFERVFNILTQILPNDIAWAAAQVIWGLAF